MLELKYKMKVTNPSYERINRIKTVFVGKTTKEILTDEPGYKEVKACRNLKIDSIKYVCPICNREFEKRHGLIVHIDKTHEESKHLIRRKW